MSDVRKRSRFVIAVLLALVMALAVSPIAAEGKPDKSAGNEVRLQLLAINDFHGQIVPYVSSSGAVSGGAALLGASPAVSGLLQDEPTIRALDLMNFKYSSVGNHEFDEGLAELLRIQYGGAGSMMNRWAPAHMQYLAANVVHETTGEPVLPPYAIENVKGIPVGIIGAVYEGTPGIVTASGVAGLDFLPEAETINFYVDELKAKGVEVIIVLLHNGGNGTTTGGPVTGAVVPVIQALDDEVDVVLTAHSHNRYWGWVDGKLVTQAYSAGRAFADIDLVIDRTTRDVSSAVAEIVPVVPNDAIIMDLRVEKLVAKAQAIVEPTVSWVVGQAAFDMTRTQNAAGESALGNLIADAQAWKQGTQVAFMNPGGIRADLFAGEVTWGELFAIQPFSNYLVTMTMTGAQIDLALEQQWLGRATPMMLQTSGIEYSWSAAAAPGAKVDPASISVGGVPLDLGATYTVTTNSFLADGGDTFPVFTSATNKVVWGYDLDALTEYVPTLPQPFGVAIEGRVHLLP
jgi:5'-nucleotidase